MPGDSGRPRRFWVLIGMTVATVLLAAVLAGVLLRGATDDGDGDTRGAATTTTADDVITSADDPRLPAEKRREASASTGRATTRESSTAPATSSAAATRTILRRAAAKAAAAGGSGSGAAVGVIGPGSVARAGDLPTTHAWSSSKVAVLSGVLRARRKGELGGGTSPTAEERRLATSALTASDNAAAESLFGELTAKYGGVDGASDVVETALQAGSGKAIPVNRRKRGSFTTFGQTELPLADGVRFFGGLSAGCVLDAADTTFVTGLMQQVVSGQRWGLGTPSWGARVAFKGGWGPEDGGSYVAVQYGILRKGSRGVAVAVAAQRPGGLEAVTPVLTKMAQALRSALPPSKWPKVAAGCPGG
ncbi:hypothetical protein [Patulibacter minatonensis]|uniref:hypothetical protein n=1 Tax=Patulibacter minatonensis TaxID=298163 RepID=UPI0006860AA6|nr:hypothetical protein [Patulibacter minatonensis]